MVGVCNMEFLSATYLISQALTIMMFICLGKSYYSTDRKDVILLNVYAQIFQILSTLLLKGFTGTVMSLVMLASDIIIYINYKKNEKVTKRNNTLILIILFAFIIGLSIITYDGILSLLSVIATIILLIGIWQEDMRVYRFTGIIGSLLWLFYYIYLKSIFAIVLESVLLVATIISYYKKN